MQTGIMRADLAFQSDRLLVSVVIQPQTRPFEPVADAGADFWRVFSDPSGENNRVRTPHACEECSNVFSCAIDRKSTRLNSSHGYISYAVFCLKKKKKKK